MRIVFGTYHINIKKYTAEDLGIQEKVEYSFAVKQQIFHLFWIPVFPLMKVYAMVDRRGEAYHAPLEIKHLIRNGRRHITPWYSFSLLILGLIVLVGIWISEQASNYESRQYTAGTKAAFTEYTGKLIKTVEKGDILVMSESGFYTDDNKSLSGLQYFICVDSIDGTDYFVRTKFVGYEDDRSAGSPEGIRAFFETSDQVANETVMTKKEIDAFLTFDNHNSNYELGGGKRIDGFGQKFYFHHILKKDKPNLFVSCNSWSNQALNLDVSYLGPVARIKKLQLLGDFAGVTPSYSSILANEKDIMFSSVIDLPGVDYEDEFKMNAVIETEDGQIYKFLIYRAQMQCYCLPQ